ncbi:MAG: GNAT family N-acetyltransferase [Chlamydiia bacterium]|nr:GNAT family N-acetyltransferase [Chlamydiia bacterium]
MVKSEQKPKLIIRNAKVSDIPAIQKLSTKVYGKTDEYRLAELRGQIRHFPEGQFVAVYEGEVIGYCASLITSEKKAMRKHSWREITGNGFCSTHSRNGDFLYGVDVFVDPEYRRMRIGERFYRERIKLCKYLRLKGIIFAGRMPLLRKKYAQVGSAENYLQAVLEKKIRDPVVNFQLRLGFDILGVIPDYNPDDRDSMGNAVHMIWHNPEVSTRDKKKMTNGQQSFRVASVQYMQREISSFEEFKTIITYYVEVVHDYRCDFVLFPELFTMQLLSLESNKLSPQDAILKLSTYTDELKDFFKNLAIKCNINIIAGSHPVKLAKDVIQNISFIFLRDGSIHEQPKLHPTPDEKYWWNISGGDKLEPIDTDCGTIGVLICYDSEFPELARHLVDQGANILFVPFCTDQRQSYLRVRYCSQARAVENQCYVILSGSVGNLPKVDNMDIHYGQSCILTPCDFIFSRDGVAAECAANIETVIFADLHLNDLFESRSSGSVINLRDRRHDLFSIVWHK